MKYYLKSRFRRWIYGGRMMSGLMMGRYDREIEVLEKFNSEIQVKRGG